MGYDLEQFSSDCHRVLAAEPGPAGREKVCDLVRKALADDGFVRANLTDDTPERQILYEDPELHFCILGHVYHDARRSAPHDHGPSWAIYGQAAGETIMSDWAKLEEAAEGKPGKVRFVRDYTLKPGMAYLYNEGDLHSPRRDAPTRLLRIEGRNMDGVKRFAYRPE